MQLHTSTGSTQGRGLLLKPGADFDTWQVLCAQVLGRLMPCISLYGTGQDQEGSTRTVVSKQAVQHASTAGEPLPSPLGGVEKHRLVVATGVSLGRAHPPKPYRVRPCRLRAYTTSKAVTVLRRACSV